MTLIAFIQGYDSLSEDELAIENYLCVISLLYGEYY